MQTNLYLSIVSFLFFILVSSFSNAQEPRKEISNQVKEWTFLIYLNGNNNLDSFGTLNINQMEEVGSTDQINIIVQWASLASDKTKRIYVAKDNNPNEVTSPVIEAFDSVDMGDWKNLAEFIRWGVVHYPAKHYFINVWDHGSGWHAIRTQNTMAPFFPMNISWDDNSGNSITTPQLSQALKEGALTIGHPIDLFATDACLMEMIEVATEVSGSVKFYAGSQEVEPGTGWPYQNILAQWIKNPQASPEEVGKILVNEYVKYYTHEPHVNNAATYALLDLSQLNPVHQSLARLGNALISASKSQKELLLEAAKKSQNFTYSDYVDLSDFLGQVSSLKIDPELRSSIVELQKKTSQLILENATTPSYAKAKGLSIWLPTDSSTFKNHLDSYQTLKFAELTQWNNVIQALVE